MSEAAQIFIKASKLKAFDKVHRATLNKNIGKYDQAVFRGKQQYQDLETARNRAANIKRKAINDLDKYLIEFEQNFTSNGGKVIWAVDAAEANREIVKILIEKKINLVVKSKSMTTEELDLNAVLDKIKIEAIETDLGEFIVQLGGEKPYHIVTPAMHKSKEEIAKLFNEKFDWDINLTPEEMTNMVRIKLREKFYNAGAGITGANFLIADTGSIALTENEGNGVLSMAFPKVHIIVAGIEKIIPSINDLNTLWPLLATHGTGQHITVYNSIVTGTKKDKETDGPKETFVILLNNKRTEVLKQNHQKVALTCIRCGACLNACPVYKNIGGHTYKTTYTGPIGSVISPWLLGMENYKHLSFASTLCGACTDVCPVRIPLQELLLENRKASVEQDLTTGSERFVVKTATSFLLKRKKMDMFGSGLKNFFISMFMGKAWGNKRSLPKIANKSFNQQWMEKQSQK
jgi:L-lactate dehydrogenase complex protein LldF